MICGAIKYFIKHVFAGCLLILEMLASYEHDKYIYFFYKSKEDLWLELIVLKIISIEKF